MWFIWVQVDGVLAYDEDQIALVILDLSDFMVWVPVILGTLTISHIINIIKEKEKDTLVTPWVNAWSGWSPVSMKGCSHCGRWPKAGNSNLVGYDEMVLTKNTEAINAFSSHVITAKANSAHTGKNIGVMTQVLSAKDGSLPQGSKNVIVSSSTKRLNAGNGRGGE